MPTAGFWRIVTWLSWVPFFLAACLMVEMAMTAGDHVPYDSTPVIALFSTVLLGAVLRWRSMLAMDASTILRVAALLATLCLLLPPWRVSWNGGQTGGMHYAPIWSRTIDTDRHALIDSGVLAAELLGVSAAAALLTFALRMPGQSPTRIP